MSIARGPLFLTLLALVVGCDSAEPEPGALLTVTAETASGAPAAGLNVFVAYGTLATYEGLQPLPARIASPGGTLDAGLPSPTPATAFARLTFTTSQAAAARVRVLDLAGVEQAVVLDEPVAAGAHRVQIDVDGWQAGVYRVVVEAGGETLDRFLLVTDSERPGEAGLAIALGRTDAQGRLVVTDSTRFPSLYDLPERFIVNDESGFALGEFAIDPAVEVVLQNANGDTDVTTVVLRDGGTEVDLTVDP